MANPGWLRESYSFVSGGERKCYLQKSLPWIGRRSLAGISRKRAHRASALPITEVRYVRSVVVGFPSN